VDECKPLPPGDFSMYLRNASHAMFPFGNNHGRAVQVDPMKPKLKPRGTNA